MKFIFKVFIGTAFIISLPSFFGSSVRSQQGGLIRQFSYEYAKGYYIGVAHAYCKFLEKGLISPGEVEDTFATFGNTSPLFPQQAAIDALKDVARNPQYRKCPMPFR